MYRGSTAIDPLSVMKKKTEGFTGKERRAFIAIRDKMDRIFKKALENKPVRKPYFDFHETYYVDSETFKPKPF
jgi:hypothetical protein